MTGARLDPADDTVSRAARIVQRIEAMEADLQRPLTIVETGSIRIDSPDGFRGDGHSTLLIARFVAASRFSHRFISIDLDHGVCIEVLDRDGVRDHVELLTMDSRIALPEIAGPIDVAYFDSGDGTEPGLILEEFLLALPHLAPTALCCCDDIPSPHKAGALLSWVRENGVLHEIDDCLLFFWPALSGPREA